MASHYIVVSTKGSRNRHLAAIAENLTIAHISSYTGCERVLQLMEVATAIVQQVQKCGGVLVHGALAVRENHGVILAGPGMIGKTTASQLLPPPWKSLSDDTTLVVRDKFGVHWAHPWPTWSRFMFGGSGGSWDVHHGVPLKGIYFLKQALTELIEPVGCGQAVSWLVESAEQVSQAVTCGIDSQELRAHRLQRFNNICALVKAVPTYLLHRSITGAFWVEIEQVMAEDQVA
jgi:SynChlorMet cassette protein ScmC